jgi:hypothetical protein
VKPFPLPLVVKESALVECTACAKCCTYVAAGIAAPDNLKNAGFALWYLYHPGVSVYHDGNGDWSVVFMTRCEHLRDDKLCGIYGSRPPICRDFDNKSCDVNDPADGQEFFEPEELLAWLAEAKPRVFKKLSQGYVPEALQPPAPMPKRARRQAG